MSVQGEEKTLQKDRAWSLTMVLSGPRGRLVLASGPLKTPVALK